MRDFMLGPLVVFGIVLIVALLISVRADEPATHYVDTLEYGSEVMLYVNGDTTLVFTPEDTLPDSIDWIHGFTDGEPSSWKRTPYPHGGYEHIFRTFEDSMSVPHPTGYGQMYVWVWYNNFDARCIGNPWCTWNTQPDEQYGFHEYTPVATFPRPDSMCVIGVAGYFEDGAPLWTFRGYRP